MKNVVWVICWIITIALYVNSSALAEENITSDSVKIKISGKGAIESGQFVSGHHKDQIYTYRPWNGRGYAELRLDAFIGEHTQIIISPEVKLWTNTYTLDNVGDRSALPNREFSYVSITNAQFLYSWGNPVKPVVQFAAGIFPYKYNPDATNLGEYLFRSGTYPPYILTSFGYPYATLTGFRLSLAPVKNLNFDLLVTSETQIEPLYDISLSCVAGYKIPLALYDQPHPFLDIGAGVDLDRFIPVAGNYLEKPKNSVYNQYLNNAGNISYYSFGGTKLMARISADLKVLLPPSIAELLGKNDGKIYSEAAILGVKDFKAYVKNYNSALNDTVLSLDTLNGYYNDMKNRIPIMFGMNWFTNPILSYAMPPCIVAYLNNNRIDKSMLIATGIGALTGAGAWFLEKSVGRNLRFDILSIEAEYYPWPFPNSYYRPDFNGEYPVPIKTKDIPPSAYKKDSWKISLFAKKAITKNFSIMGQISRDHTHNDIYYEGQRDEEEVFTYNNQYGWWFKIQYDFSSNLLK